LILVTVGGQLPFDRLIRCVDLWAGRAGEADLFAQIGTGEYTPRHMRWERFLPPAGFREIASGSEGIVAHAGVGTILTALELQKPLLVFPRRAEHREHRSDHQLGTARYFGSRGHVQAAFTEAELLERLPRLREQRPGERPAPASPQLIARLRAYAFGARPPLPP
jgi:UDP-N-acetylglucosamine transferase subunit ALG13